MLLCSCLVPAAGASITCSTHFLLAARSRCDLSQLTPEPPTCKFSFFFRKIRFLNQIPDGDYLLFLILQLKAMEEAGSTWRSPQILVFWGSDGRQPRGSQGEQSPRWCPGQDSRAGHLLSHYSTDQLRTLLLNLAPQLPTTPADVSSF